MKTLAPKASGKGLEDLWITCRTKLKERKPYRHATFGKIDDFLGEEKPGFASGDSAVYLGVYPQKWKLKFLCDPDELMFHGRHAFDIKEWIWPLYDIDGHKKNIPSAIDRAQKVYFWLEKHDLAEHAKWLLSGNGLRAILDFIIPISLRDGWMEHLQCLNREGFGVDRGPYKNTNDGGIPIRLFCYRGNPLQCQEESDAIDRHSVLIDPAILSSLTEKTYLELTAGKPDAEDYVSGTREILPVRIFEESDELPPEVANLYELLKEHQYEARLRENIRTGSPFLKIRRPAIEQALAYLDSEGIDYREKEVPFHFWSLSECPSCGEKDGHPWVLESGILRCFRDTCEANRAEGGLPPHKWIPSEFLSGLYEEPSEEHSETKIIDLPAAQKMIEDHLSLEGDLAIAVTPGAGKTHIAMQMAVSLAGDKIVTLAMPEHGLIKEWEAKLRASHPGLPILHFEGRNEKNCKKDPEVKRVSKEGYYPSQVACVWCRHCPGRSSSYTCRYYLQFEKVRSEKRGLILCTAHQLPYLIENKRIGRVSTVFIDEQALRAMIQKDKDLKRYKFLSLKARLSKEANVILEGILKAGDDLYQEVKKSAGHPIGCLYTRCPEGTWWQYKRILWDLCGITKEETIPVLSKEIDELLSERQFDLFRRGIDRKALLWLDAALHEEKMAWVRASESGVRYCTVDKFSLPDKARIIVLDATSSKKELKALFGRDFNLLNLNVGWEGIRIHIKHGMGKTKKAMLTEVQFKKHCKLIKKYIPPDSKTWLLCTHKADEERSLKWIQEAIPEVTWLSTHYFSGRGENKFEHVDGVYCFGLSIHNPDAYNENAAYLFPDDPGQQIRWIEAQNTAEIYQKAHRARFVRYPGKTLIIEGHHWPTIFGKPDKVIDLTRSGDSTARATEIALEIFDVTGFFDKTVAALFGIGVKGDEARIKSVREFFDGIFKCPPLSKEKAKKSYPLLYSLYIKVGTTSEPPIILPKRNSYQNLLLSLRDKTGDKPFQVRLPLWKNAWTGATGSIVSAQAFYQELSDIASRAGLEFGLPSKGDVRRKVAEEEVPVLRCA